MSGLCECPGTLTTGDYSEGPLYGQDESCRSQQPEGELPEAETARCEMEEINYPSVLSMYWAIKSPSGFCPRPIMAHFINPVLFSRLYLYSSAHLRLPVGQTLHSFYSHRGIISILCIPLNSVDNICWLMATASMCYVMKSEIIIQVPVISEQSFIMSGSLVDFISSLHNKSQS
ncbi:hypothetical protein KQX54_004488 [Cotesia glomerata]|uniref:Uncharacterized protein n=1 Tax=Cotesia glomerata TaxID=32391 RepID=A0AAV7I067_COTGL|nr:hypothetical protein KQX54_004488 [Cotesia glomerata]